jgi:hypothetical protein
LANAEAQVTALVTAIGKNIWYIDDLLAAAHAGDAKDAPETASVIARLRELRAAAVAGIARALQDEAYLWTPEMQASLRTSDAYFASGQSRVFQSEEEFDALLQEQSADI